MRFQSFLILRRKVSTALLSQRRESRLRDAVRDLPRRIAPVPEPSLLHGRRVRCALTVRPSRLQSGNRAGHVFFPMDVPRSRSRHPGTSLQGQGILFFLKGRFPWTRSLIKSMVPSAIAGHVPRSVRSFKYRRIRDQPPGPRRCYAVTLSSLQQQKFTTDVPSSIQLSSLQVRRAQSNLVTTVFP